MKKIIYFLVVALFATSCSDSFLEENPTAELSPAQILAPENIEGTIISAYSVLNGQIDGASNFQVFFHLTLPMLRPVILVALLIRFMDTIRIFDTIYILTAGGPGISTEVVSMFIYRRAFRHLDIGYATALSFVTLAIIVLISQMFLKSILRSTPTGRR